MEIVHHSFPGQEKKEVRRNWGREGEGKAKLLRTTHLRFNRRGWATGYQVGLEVLKANIGARMGVHGNADEVGLRVERGTEQVSWNGMESQRLGERERD